MVMDTASKINLAVLIVNTIAAFTAVVAAVVAIRGNSQARKAAQSAEEQFRTNMQELNRLINVSLFDLRSETLSEVQQDSLHFDRTRAKMLFNSEIAGLINEYDRERAEADRNKHLKSEYLEAVRQGLSGDTYDETADFLKFIDDYEAMNPGQTTNGVMEQVQDSIRRHGLHRKWRYGVSPVEEEYVDYISVNEEYSRHRMKSEAIRKQLQEKMEYFIESSLQ